MLDMNCPACGAGGRIPKDKVNTRLVCRKCLKVFHLAPSGRVILGEPPQAPTTPAAAPREKAESEFGLEVPPWLGRFARLVFSPKLLAVAAGLILVAGVYAVYSILEERSLRARTVKVARAAVMGDLGTLLEQTATGTGDDMLKWYLAMRPRCEEFKGTLRSPTPFVEVVVTNEDAGDGTASVIAHINTDESPPSAGAPGPGAATGSSMPSRSFDLALELTSADRMGWQIDGKRTLESATRAH